jgi:hypothetical protein
MMSKRIVLFSDGTGNSAARLQKTNVWRLYQALKRAPNQIAYYDDGVGSSAWKPLALVGGAVGFGLARNVQDIYTFLCRNYDPGDEIFAFGFSRGAFTIRILVGLIAARGIAPRGADLEDRVKQEWKAYRRKYGRFGRTLPAETRPHDVKIRFMGLWDTVDAYGFPLEEMRIAWDYLVWPLSMRDRELSSRVENAYHALSIDDERQTFHPVLWTEKGEASAETIADERITQVWFAGVHSNLGGGYPDDSLSYVSLKWMMTQAERCGLEIDRDYKASIENEVDESGKIYNPRGGLSALYRYMPRSIRDLSRELNRNGKDYAVYIERPKIHASVFRRLRNGTDEYAPLTLPLDYDVVLDDGRIVPGVAPTGAQETPALARQRCMQQDRLWDLVWRRRWLYFVTIFVTLAVIAVPLVVPRAWLDWGGWTHIGQPAIAVLAAFLPDFLSGWLDGYRVNPLLLVVLLALAIYLGARGARREREMRAAMHELWSQSLRGGPGPSKELPSGALNKRASAWYADKWRRRVKYVIVPTFFAATYLIIAAALVNQTAVKAAESFGWLCREQPQHSPELMPVAATCHATRIQVAAGRSYRVLLTVERPWSDKSIPAGPEGLRFESAGSWLAMKLAVPLRRHITEDWFTVMAKIDRSGLASRALPLRRAEDVDGAGDEIWEADFTADADGELLLYVNDAVLLGWTGFYANNVGSARISIEPKAN